MTLYTNEYVLLSEEDIAKIVASENGPWTKIAFEELLSLHDTIALKDNGENNESK